MGFSCSTSNCLQIRLQIDSSISHRNVTMKFEVIHALYSSSRSTCGRPSSCWRKRRPLPSRPMRAAWSLSVRSAVCGVPHFCPRSSTVRGNVLVTNRGYRGTETSFFLHPTVVRMEFLYHIYHMDPLFASFLNNLFCQW